MDSAEAFLRENSFRDLTIDEVMDGTGLSRSSFYVYFRDRHDLAHQADGGDLPAGVRQRATPGSRARREPLAALRARDRGHRAVYDEHGRLLRAIADASTEDAGVELAYRTVIEGFVDATRRPDRARGRRGRSPSPIPQRTAAALVWMNERYLTERLGREPMDDAEQVAEALIGVWQSTIYG